MLQSPEPCYSTTLPIWRPVPISTLKPHWEDRGRHLPGPHQSGRTPSYNGVLHFFVTSAPSSRRHRPLDNATSYEATRNAVRLRIGDDHEGWVLRSLKGRDATLKKGSDTAVLELPPAGGGKSRKGGERTAGRAAGADAGAIIARAARRYASQENPDSGCRNREL